MFDFIRKPFLWDVFDRNLDKEIGKNELFHLKSIQDLAVYDYVKGSSKLSIAEIGGGYSRLLNALVKNNSCTNVEKFQGVDGGPSKEKTIPNVRNVHAFLGEFDPNLNDASFDLVFSVSVVEHVPTSALEGFFKDQLRILKSGGIFLHAIDLYLEDQPTAYVLDRFEHYKAWVQNPAVAPIGAVFDGPCRFTCDMATNPDNVMHMWGRVSPSLIEMRTRAQSVSLLVGARKL